MLLENVVLQFDEEVFVGITKITEQIGDIVYVRPSAWKSDLFVPGDLYYKTRSNGVKGLFKSMKLGSLVQSNNWFSTYERLTGIVVD